MNFSKFRSFCFTFIIGLAMAAGSLVWLGISPAMAQDNPVQAPPMPQANIPDPNPKADPLLLSYQIYFTDPYVIYTSPEQQAEVFDRNGNPLGMGTFKADARDPEPALIGSLSLSLPASTDFELTAERVEATLYDARQNPIGIVLRDQGTKTSHGQVSYFEATHIVQYLPNGQCCVVDVLADALDASGGLRLVVDGSLRFGQ